MAVTPWELYRKGREHHDAVNMYRKCEQFHDFYNGDQWRGLESGGEKMPVLNFIKPVGKYKVSMIAQNKVAIVYGAMSNDPAVAQVCENMSAFASAMWEKSKMDKLAWAVVRNAFITGDHYLYCFDTRTTNAESVAQDRTPKLKMRSINKTQVYFEDEQNPEINEQEWIIIAERVPVAKVKREAKKNGISDEEIARIAADEDTAPYIGENKENEVKSEDGKCTSILFLRKTEEGILFSRHTEHVTYQPEQLLAGLSMYPLVGMRWEEKVGDARGLSAVEQMLPNQIEVNKTAARRVLAVKRFSYPKLAYDVDAVENLEALDQIGAAVGVQNLRGVPLSSVIQYMNPAPVSSDAQTLQNELITVTRELEGASDAVTGQIDPTKTSGEAIKAARDQAAVPLNEQLAAYHQLAEDVAELWWKMFRVYATDAVDVSFEKDGEPMTASIPASALDFDASVRIDISPIDPYSRLSREIALERLMTQQYITFEEYVNSLSDTSSVPKAKLEAILDKRQKEAMQQQMLAQMADPTMGGGMDALSQLSA